MTRDELKEMIADFVTDLETGESLKVCKCNWITRGPRKIYGSVNMDCPVHTKEGLILEFLTVSELAINGNGSSRAIGPADHSTLTNYIGPPMAKAEDRDGKSY